MKHLIIGGTKGIGRSIVEQLPESDTIITVSRGTFENKPAHVTHYSLDITKDPLPELDDLNSIIYCPGSINLKPINSLKEEDFLTDFHVNVLGAVRTIKAYQRTLKRNQGKIVLFSTVASKIGMPFHSSVAASKSAVEGLTKSLAAEFAPYITVNCIAPTVTETDLAAHLLRNEKAQASTAERHPLKRYLKAPEVASLACYLISEQAKNMTGQIIGLDAGIGSIKA